MKRHFRPQRRSPFTFISLLTLLCSFSFLSAVPAAAQIVVSQKAPCIIRYTAHYFTIQSAVSASPAGSTIQICPGTYGELVTIHTPLTLRGVTFGSANSDAIVIAVPSSGSLLSTPLSGWFTQVLVEAPNVTFDNITVDGAGVLPGFCGAVVNGIFYDAGSSGSVTRSALRNHETPSGSNYCLGTSLYISGSVSAAVTVQGSSFRAFSQSAIAADGPVSATGNFIDSGLSIPGTGIVLSAANSTASSNFITAAIYGIYCGTCTGATISSNTISSATGIVIQGHSASNVLISGNVLMPSAQYPPNGNGGTGILAYGNGGTIQNNQIVGQYYGMIATPSGSVPYAISGNTINDAQIGIWGVTGNSISNNTYLNVATLTQ